MVIVVERALPVFGDAFTVTACDPLPESGVIVKKSFCIIFEIKIVKRNLFMIASKPYVFPPRIVFTSLKIVRVLIIIVSLFLKTDIVICTVLFLVEQPDE